MAFRLGIVESHDEWVIVCTSPLGGTVQKLPAPFTARLLDERLARVEKSLIRSTAQVTTRRATTPERAAQDFGAELSDALLTGDVRLLFSRCRDKAREHKQTLRVLIDPVGPNVSRIPWEFAVDPDTRDDYLALRVSVARAPHLMEPVPPLRVDPPLRVLGVMARPADLPPLEAEEERRDVSQALGRLSSSMVEVEWLSGDRWGDLAEAVRSEPWHVLHFIGHGGFDEDAESGYLELSDDDGNAMPVLATDLGRLVADNPQLRLVVLNACESAVTGAAGFFSSTAAKLMREGVPAVVAMQYEISDPAALAFSSSFYEGIARGLPVDRAVTLARESVKMALRSLEWATPVLFLASDETHVFTVPGRATAAVPATSAAVRPERDRPAPEAGDPVPPGDWLATTRRKLADAVRGGSAPGDDRSARPHETSGTAATTRPSPPRTGSATPTRDAGERPVPPVRSAGRLVTASSCDAAVGPRGLVALVGTDGVLRVLSTRTGRLVGLCVLAQRERARCTAWGPWPRHVASAHDGGLVVVWDLETEVPVRVMEGGAQRVDALAFSSDGHWLATAGDCSLRVFDSQGTCVQHVPVLADDGRSSGYPRRLGELTAVAFVPGDEGLLVAGDDGLVRRYDVRARLTGTWQHATGVAALDVSTTGLTTGSVGGRVSTWGWDGRLLCRRQHGTRVDRLRRSADGLLLASVADGRSLRVWDPTGAPVAEVMLPGPAVGMGFLPDDRTVLTAARSGDVELWTLPEGS
ncbi:CHAT domain-containing WD40 repeat protein [Modestobacter marinus]|nr:CHAT domain-containing protein [Modestobacter marinus]NIH68023.1 hypothetical protein [Modestobacter marinus]